jgi:fatty acid desaturase
VEFLCHDISVHVPHHVSSKIPWYNLRKANDSLKQNWGQYMTSCTFNWRMMKTIFTGEGESGAGVQACDNRAGAGECLLDNSWRSAW